MAKSRTMGRPPPWADHPVLRAVIRLLFYAPLIGGEAGPAVRRSECGGMAGSRAATDGSNLAPARRLRSLFSAVVLRGLGVMVLLLLLKERKQEGMVLLLLLLLGETRAAGLLCDTQCLQPCAPQVHLQDSLLVRRKQGRHLLEFLQGLLAPPLCLISLTN